MVLCYSFVVFELLNLEPILINLAPEVYYNILTTYFFVNIFLIICLIDILNLTLKYDIWSTLDLHLYS
jgi:hypothetical protein